MLVRCALENTPSIFNVYWCWSHVDLPPTLRRNHLFMKLPEKHHTSLRKLTVLQKTQPKEVPQASRQELSFGLLTHLLLKAALVNKIQHRYGDWLWSPSTAPCQHSAYNEPYPTCTSLSNAEWMQSSINSWGLMLAHIRLSMTRCSELSPWSNVFGANLTSPTHVGVALLCWRSLWKRPKWETSHNIGAPKSVHVDSIRSLQGDDNGTTRTLSIDWAQACAWES